MADEVAYKKIVWRLSEPTKKFADFQPEESLQSARTKVVIGDNITEWSLGVYPGGLDNDSICLTLRLEGADSKSFTTKITLGIVGKNGNKEQQGEKPGNFFEKCSFGRDILKRADFFNSDLGYLIDGKATIYCELTITCEKVPESNKANSLNQTQHDKFKTFFKRMFVDELFADFQIETTEKNNEKKLLKAHKNVLAFGSPYFYGMLTTDLKETEENVVKVPEDSVIMKEVLRFIYMGDVVKDLNEIANELVFAAEKYQLNGLKEMCLDSIIKSLSVENVLQALLAADHLTDSEKLKGKCIQMAARNFKSLYKTEEWKKLSPGLLTEILHQVSDDSETAYV